MIFDEDHRLWDTLAVVEGLKAATDPGVMVNFRQNIKNRRLALAQELKLLDYVEDTFNRAHKRRRLVEARRKVKR